MIRPATLAAARRSDSATASGRQLSPLLLSKRDAAKLLGGISERSLDRLAASGRIRPVRVTPGTLRYRREDLEAFVANCEYSRGESPGA